MIREWTLENFKSVNKKTALEFAPLTVFAGANSSGKSTIIQSLLLTTQTIQSQVRTRPVVLNGHIVRLGTFGDILSNQSRTGIITIGFELTPSFKKENQYITQPRNIRYLSPEPLEAITSIHCDFSFSAEGDESERDILQLQPRIESCHIRTQGKKDDKVLDETIKIVRSSSEPMERLRSLLVRSDNAMEINGLEYEVISKPPKNQDLRRHYRYMTAIEYVGAVLQHFLPSRFVVKYDKTEEQSRRILDYLFNIERAVITEAHSYDTALLSNDFKNSLLAMLLETIRATTSVDPQNKRIENTTKLYAELEKDFSTENLQKVNRSMPIQIRLEFFRRLDENRSSLLKILKEGKDPDHRLALIPLHAFSDVASELVQTFFANNVKYLGPLRDEPKPVYPLAGNIDTRDIGFKGENTAAVLEVHRNTKIDYVPCNSFTTLNHAPQILKGPLVDAVLDWLKYLGVANEISTIDKGKLGHELKVSTVGSAGLHDLTHVGVGVSQVLPILIQSLLSEPGSTLIFEQPELHLHPKVQTRLADFFVSMTILGKQCIIETHSEYMINRLRYMSAITEGDSISKDVIIYFVEKEKGSSNFRSIRINRYGVIEEWPNGFFDENEANAAEVLRAGMQKKKAEKDQLQSS